MKITGAVINSMILFIIGVLTYILVYFVMYKYDNAYPFSESGWLYISILIPAFSFGTIISMFLKKIVVVKSLHVFGISIGVSIIASLLSVLIVYGLYKNVLNWDASYAPEPGVGMESIIFGLGGLIGSAVLFLLPMLILKTSFSVKKIAFLAIVGFVLGVMAAIVCRYNEVIGLIFSNGIWFALMGVMILKNVNHLNTKKFS